MSQELEMKQMDEKQRALMQTVRETVFPGATDPELALFFNRCAVVGCNPLDQLIFPMKFQDKNSESGFKVVFITSINLLRSKSEESGVYNGMDEPEFSDEKIELAFTEKVWKDNFSEDVERTIQVPEWCKVKVYRKDVDRPFIGKCYWTEYYPGQVKGAQWRMRPHVMLAKVAEALARRLAFPDKLNKLYTDEELMINTSEMAGVDAPRQSTKPSVNPDDIKPRSAPAQSVHGDPTSTNIGTVNSAKTVNGKKVFYAITIDKKEYSTFSETHYEVANTLIGKKCEFTYEQNGKYLNLKGIRPSLATTQVQPQTPSEVPEEAPVHDDEDLPWKD